MPKNFDVFLSYARVDSAQADPLVRALERAGVTYWRDTEQVDTFGAIRRAIDEGLARSKVLLALYSRAYTERRACDWELAAAFTAGGPERILVLNPEDGADHIQPQNLREHLFANLDDLDVLDALATKIKARVQRLDQPFGQLRKPPADQKWFGLSPKGAAQTFVGRRAEIWQVHDALAVGDSVMVAPTTTGLRPGDGSTLVRGLGGMGKTLLAEEYARRFAAAWPGGIFWLKAGGGDADGTVSESRLMEQYLALARALTLTFDPADPASLKNAVEAAMGARPAPYLWVVDDLPHGLSIEQARAWFAPGGQGCTLVTTRTRTLDDIAKPVKLAELGEDEAYILLTLNREPKDEAEAKAARAIVQELGRHALAVDLARHLVERQGYGKVLADLRNPSTEALGLAAKLSVELPTGHDKSIAQTFLRSIDLLDANALDALRVAAHLAPHTAIPRDLLAAIRMHADDQTEEQAEEDAVLALDQVAAHSLCDITETGYVVHALVCRTMALRYADDRSQILEQASLAVLLHRLRRADDARNHPHLAPIIPHAHAASELAKTENHARLDGWIGRYYMAAGLNQIALQFFLQSKDAHSRLLGQDHQETLASINNVAEVFSAQGNFPRARALQEQVLSACINRVGMNHPDTFTCMNNLSVTLMHLGHFRSAKELQHQALSGRRSVLGPDHPHTLSSMINLAEVLRTQGDHGGAALLERQAVGALTRVLGPDHPDTLTGMSNLASSLRNQDDLNGAKTLQQQVLSARCGVLGPEHPDTLTSMNNLAATLYAQGDLNGARDLQERALEANHRILGPDHPATLTCMHNLALTLSAQGDAAAARDLQEHALWRCRHTIGPDHPNTLMSALMLSQYLAMSGELEEAEKLATWAARGLETNFGTGHQHTQMAQTTLAIITARRNNAPDPG